MELAVRRMLERRVDGVAILTFGMEDSLIEDLHFRRVPLVFVDVGPDLPRVSNISINYKNGIRQAVQHLAALRHTRIGFITGPLHLKSAVARRQAFEQSMNEIGLEPSLLSVGDHTVEGGMRSFSELWQTRNCPTAILCSNDMTAIGVMREAYQRGIQIPCDLSLIGFDDIRLAQFATPPLTTVQMSQHELARLAFEALVKDSENPAASQRRTDYAMNTTLVLRNSTALAPKSSASRSKGR
jgi:LacI family transcriptional regulator